MLQHDHDRQQPSPHADTERSAVPRGHRATSGQAADRFAQHAPRVAAQVRRAFEDAGPEGLADHELEQALPRLSANSVRPRRVYMTKKGILADSGRRRAAPSGTPCIVWCLARFAPQGGVR
jgi:hypothetical protein